MQKRGHSSCNCVECARRREDSCVAPQSEGNQKPNVILNRNPAYHQWEDNEDTPAYRIENCTNYLEAYYQYVARNRKEERKKHRRKAPLSALGVLRRRNSPLAFEQMHKNIFDQQAEEFCRSYWSRPKNTVYETFIYKRTQSRKHIAIKVCNATISLRPKYRKQESNEGKRVCQKSVKNKSYQPITAKVPAAIPEFLLSITFASTQSAKIFSS